MSTNYVDQTRLGIAALASCFAKTIEQRLPEFAAEFDKQLLEHFRELKNNSTVDHTGALETLQWAAKLLDRPFAES